MFGQYTAYLIFVIMYILHVYKYIFICFKVCTNIYNSANMTEPWERELNLYNNKKLNNGWYIW